MAETNFENAMTSLNENPIITSSPTADQLKKAKYIVVGMKCSNAAARLSYVLQPNIPAMQIATVWDGTYRHLSAHWILWDKINGTIQHGMDWADGGYETFVIEQVMLFF